jgi:hypothetical protein
MNEDPLAENTRENSATQQQGIARTEWQASLLSSFSLLSTTDSISWTQPAIDDPAIETVIFQGRCDVAAWRIQESFRNQRKRRSSDKQDERHSDEAIQIKKRGHEDTDDNTSTSSPSSARESDEHPDKPQIDRSALYSAIVVFLFSISMFIFRQIHKFCGMSTQSGDDDLGVTQDLGDNALDAVGAHVVQEGILTNVGGASGGTGGGGGATGNSALVQGMATQAASSAASAGAAASGAITGVAAAGAMAQVGLLAAITSSAPAAAATAAMVSVVPDEHL